MNGRSDASGLSQVLSSEEKVVDMVDDSQPVTFQKKRLSNRMKGKWREGVGPPEKDGGFETQYSSSTMVNYAVEGDLSFPF